ncbi:MAG TPA: biotin transporter BioY [Geminicoccaceae bacterium]|nr:biotin transporter BioY [Geminicoccaceae bacterium]
MLDARASARHIADLVWPAGSRLSPVLRAVGLALLGTLLLTASAKVQVPFYPVPMTLQTMVVFLIGIAYGPRLGVATVALYLLQGALGYPVFAGTPEKGIGLAYMMGPTGGYLAGFLVAAAVTGTVAERLPRWPAVAAGIALATVLVYLLGTAWLATLVGIDRVWALGVAPFLLGDLVKLLLATALAELGLSALRRRLDVALPRGR